MGFLTSAKGGLGIYVGPGGVGAVRLSQKGRVNRVEAACWKAFAEKALEGNYLDAAVFNPGVVTDALSGAVSEVWKRRRGEPPEVAVALDDNFTSTVFLSLVSLPPKRREAEMILEHKIHETHPYLKQQELILDFAAIRSREVHKGQRKFMATFMLRSFSEALKGCFTRADLFPASLDSAWAVMAAGLDETDQFHGSVSGVAVLACYGPLSTTVALLDAGEATHLRKSNSGLETLGASGAREEFDKTLSFFQDRGFIDASTSRLLWAAADSGESSFPGEPLSKVLGIAGEGWTVAGACAAMGGFR